MASAVVFESTAAQAVGPCSLLASVTAPGGRRFVHDNLAKAGTLRLQFLPEPFRHFFNRWVLQSFDVVEISVVQHFQERFLKLCPCTPRHLCPSGALGKVCAASNVKSFVNRARINQTPRCVGLQMNLCI